MIVIPSLVVIGTSFFIKQQNDRLKNLIYSSLFLILTAINLSVVIYMGWRWKALIAVSILILIVSWFFGKHYKKFVVLLGMMTVFALVKFTYNYFTIITATSNWVTQTELDTIEFSKKPNIYLIQPDGYASKTALENAYYNYENDTFYDQLKQNGFLFNHTYRSNYGSTLTSNATLFTAQHHFYNYGNMDNELPNARNLIMGKNPVLSTLKNNGYATTAVLQHRYLLLNHPDVFYDHINITSSELSVLPNYLYNADYVNDLKKFMKTASDQPQFYFIELLEPSHITGKKNVNSDRFQERNQYIKKLKNTNKQLLALIKHIGQQDPTAVIIIAADHGGYVGYNYTRESMLKTTNDMELKAGIFESLYAIRYSKEDFSKPLPKSSINLFPHLFSLLSKDSIPKKDNSSYQIIKSGKEQGVYRYYDNDGNATMEKVH